MMLEIPESIVIAGELEQTVSGKKIRQTVANSSPHGFAFYFGDPKNYGALLNGKTIQSAHANAGQIELCAEEMRILFSDGVNVRYFSAGEALPQKHQLWIEFEDDSSLICTIQMYGGLWAFREGQNDNKYYPLAKKSLLH
jgi:formamidopyrimidine-DNA glycosylase